MHNVRPQHTPGRKICRSNRYHRPLDSHLLRDVRGEETSCSSVEDHREVSRVVPFSDQNLVHRTCHVVPCDGEYAVRGFVKSHSQSLGDLLYSLRRQFWLNDTATTEKVARIYDPVD